MHFGAEGGWWVILFPIVVGIIAGSLTYFTLAIFFNHTELEVTADLFETGHGPLPWFGAMSLPTHEITQFYSKHILGNKGMFAYELLAVTRDGKSHRVLGNLETPDIPLFLEQHIEKWLKLKDMAVSGELPRK
jgi:hypothetical protein